MCILQKKHTYKMRNYVFIFISVLEVKIIMQCQ